MVADLDFPVEIVGVPTVREDDGLALSSRNRYLSAPERDTALALSRALFAAATGSPRGRRCAAAPGAPPAALARAAALVRRRRGPARCRRGAPSPEAGPRTDRRRTRRRARGARRGRAADTAAALDYLAARRPGTTSPRSATTG